MSDIERSIERKVITALSATSSDPRSSASGSILKTSTDSCCSTTASRDAGSKPTAARSKSSSATQWSVCSVRPRSTRTMPAGQSRGAGDHSRTRRVGSGHPGAHRHPDRRGRGHVDEQRSAEEGVADGDILNTAARLQNAARPAASPSATRPIGARGTSSSGTTWARSR